MERNKKRRKRISQEEKMEIVRLHYLEGVSQSELARRYDTSQSVVWRIIRTFASENDKIALLMKNEPVDSQAEEIKALKAEILELKKKLYEETMRADFCDTMVDVAEEMFGIEIRKKADTLIHHSDRGTQYASAEYIKQLRLHDITPSMTESGNPKDLT